MTLETLAEIGHEFNNPRFSVTVAGTEYEETTGLITAVTVDRSIDGADHFSLSIGTRFDYEDASFRDFDWDDFAVGDPVAISIGYGATLTQVFSGKITDQSTDFPAGGPPTIGISGYGQYHELTTDVVEEQWEEMTDAAIAEAIAAEYDLVADVDATPIEREKVEVEHDSDAAFLEEKLAGRNDEGTGPFEVFARLDELVFRAPRDDRDPELELTWGESLQSFSPELTDAQTPASIEVHHWDPTGKHEIVGVAEHDTGSGRRVIRRPVRSEAEAEELANAFLREAENERLQGTGTTIGLPEIEIGEPIELSGLGDRFSGTYYLETVTHSVNGNGFRTDFSVREARAGVLT